MFIVIASAVVLCIALGVAFWLHSWSDEYNHDDDQGFPYSRREK